MSKDCYYYMQLARMLKDQTEGLQREYEELQKACVGLSAEFELMKANYDEKLNDLINGIISYNTFMQENDGMNEDVRKMMMAFKEQALDLIAVIGELMRERKRDLNELLLDLDEVLLQVKQIPINNAKRKRPVEETQVAQAEQPQKKKLAKEVANKPTAAATKRQAKK